MAIALTLSLNVISASAVASGSLTIEDQATKAVQSNSSYSAYQIVSWDSQYGNMQLSQAYRPAVLTTLNTFTDLGASLPPDAPDSTIMNRMSKMNADETALMAAALQDVSAGPSYTTTDGYFQSMAPGYYLVVETADNSGDTYVISKPMLVRNPDPITGSLNVVVYVKHSAPTIEKKIIETRPNKRTILVDANATAVGKPVYYQSVSTIPTYVSNATNLQYYYTDTFSTGLTFNTNSVVVKLMQQDGTTLVKNLTTQEPAAYTLTEPDAQTFLLNLNSSDEIKLWGNNGYKILITYSAILNSNASYGSKGNPNTIELTYTNNPKDGSTKKLDDTVFTYTDKLIITKYGSDGKTPLQGATFALYYNDGSGNWGNPIDTQTSDANGVVNFLKLMPGHYKLVEVSAPGGYNLMDPFGFEVSAKFGPTAVPNESIILINKDPEAPSNLITWASSNPSIITDGNGYLTTEITDTMGFVLPGTGGIGTALFTSGGILIIILASITLVAYFRKRRVESGRM